MCKRNVGGRTWRFELAALVAMLTVTRLAIAAPHAASIFDDDYVPPSSKVGTPDRATATPVPSPHIEEQRPAIPKVEQPVALPQAQEPIPSAAELARSRKLFKEVFAKQLGDRSPSGRRALAEKLLEEAGKLAQVPTDRYVLLVGARQAAVEGSDLRLCVKAADALGRGYRVDALQVKVDAALKAGVRGDSAAIAGENCRAGLEVIEQLLAMEDYGNAARIAGALQVPAASDPMFNILVQQRAKEVEALRIGRDRIAADLVKLKAAPDDPGANGAVGSYHCLLRGDWDQGLPMLAKGSAAASELAKAELTKTSESSLLVRLGDGWWELADKQGELPRSRMRQHAATLYRRAFDDATGLRKTALEQRISEAVGVRLVELLPMVDPTADSTHGVWSVETTGLTSSNQVDRLELPYQPPEEYLFRIEFTRVEGDEAVAQWMSKSSHSFLWIMGIFRSTTLGFEKIDGKFVAENPTRIQVKRLFENRRRYVSVVEVRNGRMRAYIEGKLMSDLKTDYHEFSSHDSGEWQPRDPLRLAIGTLNSPSIFHHIEVLELSGVGKVLR
jgi:hypothetical protein